MKRTKQPVKVYEREGADGLITFYHHITIHGNRERVRLEALGRHKRNTKSYLVAKRSAQEAATVKCADIFRGDYGIVENRGHVPFMQLVREHCEGKARAGMRVSAAERFWGSTTLGQVNARKVEQYKAALMSRYACKTAFEVFTITCKAVLRFAFEEGWIRTDPSRRVQNPPNVAQHKSPLLTTDEVQRWLRWKAPEGSSELRDVHRASCFMLHTGLLWCEINNLTYADIKEGYLELVRRKNRNKQHAKEFCIVLSQEALRAVGTGRPGERLFEFAPSAERFKVLARKIARDVSIEKKVNVRTFRHTLLTQMSLNGAGAHAIQSVAGHSRITMSQEYVRRAEQLQMQHLENVYRI